MRMLAVFVVLLVNCFTVFAGHPDSLAEAGWSLAGKNNLKEAQALFQKALEQDPSQLRANLGMTFIFDLQKKYDQAWPRFQAAAEKSGNPNAYLFAAWSTPKVTNSYSTAKKNFSDYLSELINTGDSTGTLTAMAREQLGRRALNRGNYEQSESHFKQMNTIENWLLAGPFDNTSGSGFDKTYLPEQTFDPKMKTTGQLGIPVSWFKVPEIRRDKWVDMTYYYPQDNAVFYGNVFLKSVKDEVVHLRVGTSGSVKAFVNGREIISVADENNNDLDTYCARFTLPAGTNRLLIKVGYSEISSCNFMVRITDPIGKPVPGIEPVLEADSWNQSVPGEIVQIPNFSELYFRQQISQNPDRLENYLLLADACLRNDKAPEAERVLKSALKIAPDQVFLLEKLIESNQRNEKSDDNPTLFEKIGKLYPEYPEYQVYRFYRAVNNEEYSAADGFAARYADLSGKNESWYEMKIRLHSAKKEQEKVDEYNREAFGKFPENEDFLGAVIQNEYWVKQDYAECERLTREYLEKRVDLDVLNLLSAITLTRQDRDGFKEAWDRTFLHEPVACGRYNAMADLCLRIKDFEAAEKAIDNALRIAPFSSAFWKGKAEIARTQGKNEVASECYTSAIIYDPQDYEVRQKLRELKGLPDLFDTFHKNNIDSLIAAAPAGSDSEDDEALVLLDDTKRVLYENGGSEGQVELLFKVLNDEGIERYKEYTVNGSGNGERIDIDKAVVRKPSGDEIRADINSRTIVFKNLEKNDILYIKYKLKSYYRGSLSDQTWEHLVFSYDIPVINVSYSVLAMYDRQINWRAINRDIQPEKRMVSNGTVYTWKVQNLSPLKIEPAMLPIYDAGIGVQVSTIPDWEFMVNWYASVTKDKTRADDDIREAVARLIPDIPGTPDTVKVRRIHDFIKKNIQYSYVSFRQSGLIPQRARDVLNTRMGDCKDMATLCISMLTEAGVPAWYTLVNTVDEGFYRNSLPGLYFNHCIVAAQFAGKLHFLDLTADNYSLGVLPDGDLGALALLIKPGERTTFYLQEPVPELNRISRISNGVLSQDGSVSMKYESERMGIQAAYLRSAYKGKSKDEQIKIYMESNSEYPQSKVKSLEFTGLDSLTTVVKALYVVDIPNFAKEISGFRLLTPGWSESIGSMELFTEENRENDLYIQHSGSVESEKITVELPAGMKPAELIKDQNLKSPFGQYQLQFRYEKGKLTGIRKMKYLKFFITPAEYSEARKFFNQVKELDKTQILLKKGK